MMARFDYRRFVDDFLLGDRRLAERHDLTVDLMVGRFDREDRERHKIFVSPRNDRIHQAFETSAGGGLLEIEAPSPFSAGEKNLLIFLGRLLKYVGTHPHQRPSIQNS